MGIPSEEWNMSIKRSISIKIQAAGYPQQGFGFAHGRDSTQRQKLEEYMVAWGLVTQVT